MTGDLDDRPYHRKISRCLRSQYGAERFAHLRNYLSATRKKRIPAITALVYLFEGHPWMPPSPSAT